MDAFGDDNFGSSAEVDPAAEFLAREQDQLAGLEDELEPIAAAVKPDIVDPFDSEPLKAENISEDFSSAPEDTFEVIDAPSADTYDSYPDPESDFFGAAEPEAPLSDDQDEPAAPTPKVMKEEPEKIRKWREEQKDRLEEKDAAEELAIEKLRKQAAEELEEWSKNHNESIAKTRAANRNAEKQFVAETDEIEPGTEWERIAKLCDFNPKSNKSCKDVSRMRSIILQLKQTPLPTKD